MYNENIENTEVSSKINESKPIKMTITYCNQQLSPKEIAEILNEYYAKNGPPPNVTESLHVYVDEEGKVHIEPFSVKETA